MAQTVPDLLYVLRTSDVFRQLTVAARQELAAMGRVEQYRESTLLTPQGATPDYIRYVVAGSVNLTYTTPDGKIAALPIFRGNWATWLGCIVPSPIDYAIWTSKSATLVAFPAAAVRRHVVASPEALVNVIGSIGRTMRFLVVWALQTSVLTPDKRLASLLLLATEMASSEAFKVAQIRISQEQFGHLGLGTRQRVGRLLRDLAARGLVEMKYGQVMIPSREKLTAYIEERSEGL